MNQKLQQAIAAVRSGDNKKAQYLLTQTLQENPDETQAWYLLSLLVDSEEKQVTYLNRVLALEPDHQKAQERLAALTAVSPVAVSSDDLSLAEQESSDALPLWMADDLPDSYVEAVPEDDLEEIFSEPEAEELPDWLQGNVVDEWAVEDEQAESPEETAVPATVMVTPVSPELAVEKSTAEPDLSPAKPAAVKKAKPAPAKKGTGSSSMTLVLAILIILALVVGGFLIYLILTL
ncbi:MAG: hypothetical protein H6659_10300 [Ardenticatenaceae bacterium]|nr:hypothetical protein [Ardenticatenaceae bacterium]